MRIQRFREVKSVPFSYTTELALSPFKACALYQSSLLPPPPLSSQIFHFWIKQISKLAIIFPSSFILCFPRGGMKITFSRKSTVNFSHEVVQLRGSSLSFFSPFISLRPSILPGWGPRQGVCGGREREWTRKWTTSRKTDMLNMSGKMTQHQTQKQSLGGTLRNRSLNQQP